MYLFLALIFSTITLIVNIMSAKLVSLPIASIVFTAGFFFHPLTFFINDLVTEIYGLKSARQMVLLSFAMSLFSYGIIKLCLWMPPHDPEIQTTFERTFSLNGLAILSSMVAFAVSQLLDSSIYQKLKNDKRPLWVRNQGSLVISQFMDSLIVHSIFFHWGQGWSWDQTLLIIGYSFLYKSLIALTLLPFFIGIVKSRLLNRAEML